MGVSECCIDVLINSFEEAYSVQLVKLGLGSVQAVAIITEILAIRHITHIPRTKS